MQNGSCTHPAGKHFKTGKAESAGLLRLRLELLEYHFLEIVLDRANYMAISDSRGWRNRLLTGKNSKVGLERGVPVRVG